MAGSPARNIFYTPPFSAMRIKRLEIFGFKSFMDKTVISFPPGISAIVGPNGCGKSNVLDALKWVMGEQSARQLRGKAMEDVIFSGTVGKHPLNMAEVSLTLSNDNGSSPPEYREYAEIMITRRLYRSGESVYWLNKRPCRLKDIQHLLLGSGAGSRSYACIQQGNIGAITEATPDERRHYLEEASEATRYKSRRVETEKKLDETRRNLVRLNDILGELHKQVSSLEKQKKRAEKFNKYQKKRRKAEILVSLVRIHQLTQETTDAHRHLILLKDTDLEQGTRLSNVESHVQGLKTAIHAKQEEISHLTTNRFDIQRRLDRTGQESAHLQEDLNRCRFELNRLEQEQRDMETVREKMEREIAELENRETELRNQSAMMQNGLLEKQHDGTKLMEEIRSLSGELEDHRKKWVNFNAQEARLQQMFRSAIETRQQLRRKIKQVDEEALRSTRNLTTLEESLQESVRLLDGFSKDLSDSEHQERVIRMDLDSIGRDLADVNMAARKRETEKQQIHTRFATLKKMSDNLEWYQEGVRYVLRGRMERNRKSGSMPAGDRPGIIGVLADVIQAEEGYETALENALDNILQVVLVEGVNTAVQAISDLKSARTGRCRFFPVNQLLSAPETPPKTEPSSLLIQHVHIKPGFEAVVKKFLGQTIVVDTLEEALSLRGISENNSPIVTREGELIDSGDILTGGHADSSGRILAHKNEMGRLGETIRTLENELTKISQQKMELDSRMKDAENRLQAFLSHRSRLRERISQEEKNRYQIEEKWKNAKRHLAIVELDQERLAGEEIDSGQEMERSEALLQEIQHDIASMKDQIEKISARITEKNTVLDHIRQEITRYQVSKTSVDVQLENALDTLRRIREFQSESADRTKRIETGLADHRNRIEACVDRQGQLEIISIEDTQRLVGVLQDLEVHERAYSELDKQLQQQEERMEMLRREQGNIQKEMQNRETAVAQLTAKRDLEIRSVESQYHQTLAEYQEEMRPELENPSFCASWWESESKACQVQLARLQHVNTGAIQAYDEVQSRIAFLQTQKEDLSRAISDLEAVIRRINRITQEKLMETFHAVNEKLRGIFPRLFEGGSACITMTDPDKPLETGIEFMIQPPGKKLTRISLLSGGEKALSAIAFVFSIFLIKPATFCLMDEIDASLDEANVFRFNQLLKIIGENSQIIMVTHNRRSMEFADVLLGVTSEKKGISRIVTVNLDRFSPPVALAP
jgi:chromosome segregation protein